MYQQPGGLEGEPVVVEWHKLSSFGWAKGCVRMVTLTV